MAVSYDKRARKKPWLAKGRVRELYLDVFLGYFYTKEEAEEAVIQWREARYGNRDRRFKGGIRLRQSV